MKHHIASLGLVVVITAAFAVPAGAVADASSTVSPAGKSLGVGVELGAPTSLNAKFMLAPNQGIVLGVGGGIWYDYSLSLHADYLWHPFVMPFNSGAFSAFVGAGAWTSLGVGGPNYKPPHFGYYQPFYSGLEQFAIGARVPLGLAVAFNEVPVEVFVEVVPALQVFPAIGIFGQGGLGARFYF